MSCLEVSNIKLNFTEVNSGSHIKTVNITWNHVWLNFITRYLSVFFVQTYRLRGNASYFCLEFLGGTFSWRCNSTRVSVCLCVSAFCLSVLCWQWLSLIVVCLLETAAGDVNLSSAEPLQLFSIHHGLCWRVALSVCAVWRNSRMSLSANRSLCLAHDHGITLAGPAVSAPVFVCVGYEKVCAWVSDLSAVISTQPQAHTHTHARYSSGPTQTRPRYYEGFIFSLLLWQFPSFPTASLSSILLLPSHPPCLLLAPFLLVTSSQPHPLSFSLVILPPALLLPSRPSWGVQWDGNGRAVAYVCVCVCVCVCARFGVCLCDVTPQQLYSSSLFFNPRAHRPHCYFKIL